MHPLHRELIKQIHTISGLTRPDFEGFALRYMGTDKSWYHLKSGQNRQIAKEFTKSNHLTTRELSELINSLYQYGKSLEEISIAALIVGESSQLRQEFDLDLLDRWLSFVHGWAECDVLCQMAFTDTDLLDRWDLWRPLLVKLNQDENVHKRRASLVLLTKPVRLSTDKRLSEIALVNTDNLKLEKDILITKAVSWILRSLIKHHRAELCDYVESNENTLPKIALREVQTKLLTGKKYINHKKS